MMVERGGVVMLEGWRRRDVISVLIAGVMVLEDCDTKLPTRVLCW